MDPRVLLVEDRQNDRDILCEALQAHGADVTAIGSDVVAYGLFEAAEPPMFDAIVADIDLGVGTTGFDVARAARRRLPDIVVAYVSGYARHQRTHHVEGGRLFDKDMRLQDTAAQIMAFLNDELRRRRAEGNTDPVSLPPA